MVTRAQIISEARSWMRPATKWQHQASCKGVATDCIGFVGGVALALGIQGAREWADDPGLHCYGITPDPIMLIGGADRFLDRIPPHTSRPGDVLVMAFEEDPQHFGIITALNPMYLIHAYYAARRVVENGIGMSRVKVLRAYRFRGIA